MFWKLFKLFKYSNPFESLDNFEMCSINMSNIHMTRLGEREEKYMKKDFSIDPRFIVTVFIIFLLAKKN